VIGYYIHHSGHGHLARAGNLAAATREPVVALSSLAEPGMPSPAGSPWRRTPPSSSPQTGTPAARCTGPR
jgi:hypothetical protein